MIEFTVEGPPRVKARAREDPRTGRWYTPERTAEAEQRVGWAFRKAHRGPPDHDHWWALSAVVVTAPRALGDWDNYGKLLSDALNRLCWWDDWQVTRAHIERRWSTGPEDPPRTLVIVTMLDPIPGRDHDDQTQARSRSPRPRSGGRPVGGVGRAPVPGEG